MPDTNNEARKGLKLSQDIVKVAETILIDAIKREDLELGKFLLDVIIFYTEDAKMLVT